MGYQQANFASFEFVIILIISMGWTSFVMFECQVYDCAPSKLLVTEQTVSKVVTVTGKLDDGIRKPENEASFSIIFSTLINDFK